MRRWYVKSTTQVNHFGRATALGCEAVLESTSSQVHSASPRPHVIVQTRLGVNHVFAEPTTLAALDAVQDEPETPQEASRRRWRVSQQAALGRMLAADPATILDPNARAIVTDLLVYLGLRP